MPTGSLEEAARLLQWCEVIDESSYYEILGVLEGADALAVKSAFHKFALAFHPDNHLDAPDEVRDAARLVFRRGAEAYRVLSDAGLRAKYDLSLARGHLRLASGEIPKAALDGALQSLEDVARTAAAKLCARRADGYLGAGDLAAAKRELKMALHHDGSNPELEERIDAVDLAMFAMGD